MQLEMVSSLKTLLVGVFFFGFGNKKRAEALL